MDSGIKKDAQWGFRLSLIKPNVWYTYLIENEPYVTSIKKIRKLFSTDSNFGKLRQFCFLVSIVANILRFVEIDEMISAK